MTADDLERTVILPWRMVLHDNHRLMPAKIGKSVRLITSPEYRSRKAEAEVEIMRQWRVPRLDGDVVLHARVFFPNKRKRDAGNYRKLITDAMTGICYGDDAQLSSETWQRVGVTKDAPRIEVTLSAGSAYWEEPVTQPKPYQVPPHICGHATVNELDPETERCIEYAVYGPQNWLNVDQLRRRIHELVKEALEKKP